jgi:cytoskeleton-associated protein 5
MLTLTIAMLIACQGTTLAQALYRYLGPALMPTLGDLKPVQQKELEAGFDVLDEKAQGAGSGKPVRFTRKEARAQAERESSGAPADAGEHWLTI